MTLLDRLNVYEKLMRLDKPIGILLLLWPTLWGLWLSTAGQPNWVIVWIFVLGTVLMRSAGCVINDYVDRDIDPHVARTQNRPLAAGLVSKEEALALAATLALLAFLMILPLNRLTLMLSVVALVLAATYPFTKRFFALPQAYLGVAFGFGIPMAYAAQIGFVPPIAWMLLGANVFWAIAYDTQYAMVDREDDMKIGIKTSALTFGKYDVAAVMACYGVMLLILVWVGRTAHLRWPYYLGLALAAGLMAYHYSLIRNRDRERCFKAFLHNNWVGAAIFAGIALDFLLRR
ncbi:MAG: 4-hydroxybenzoate octaprenyltransferase [Burkholderiales bacterium]